MQRRDVLKLLAIGSAFPSIPPPLLAGCRVLHASLTETTKLKILSPHQDATVTVMAELIIPRTETPGAKDTNVNLFIDRVLADWYTEGERARFVAGLADVDARAQALFEKNFVDAAGAQQAEILRSLGEGLAEAMAVVANGPRGNRGAAPEPAGHFYLEFRKLVLMGYFTSEAGFSQQLGEEIVPGRFDGCAPLQSSTPIKGS